QETQVQCQAHEVRPEPPDIRLRVVEFLHVLVKPAAHRHEVYAGAETRGFQVLGQRLQGNVAQTCEAHHTLPFEPPELPGKATEIRRRQLVQLEARTGCTKLVQACCAG